MKKKYLNMMSLCVISMFSLFPLACSEDNNEEEDAEEMEVTYPTYSQEQINEWAADNIITWLCDVTNDTLTGKITSQTPNYGVVLHDDTPTIRYTRSATLADARETFLSWITSDASKDSTQDGGISVNMGGEGIVSFRPETGEGQVAVADIRMKRLPDITQVVFVKPEAWPENGNNIGIMKYSTWIKDGKIYVCVRDCENGRGYLVHFVTQDRRVPYHKAKYKKNIFHKTVELDCYDLYRFDNDRYLRGGSESVEAIRTFLYKMSNGRWVKDLDAEKVLQQIGKEQNVGSSLSSILYEQNVFFFHGDEKGDVDTCEGKEGTKYHFIRYPYCRLTRDRTYARRFRYSCWMQEEADDCGAGSRFIREYNGTTWARDACSWKELMDIDVIPFDTYNSIAGLGINKKSFR